MTKAKRPKMTREDEYEFYARPENQEPQGPARRRASRLTEMVPVRFSGRHARRGPTPGRRGRPVGVGMDPPGRRARVEAGRGVVAGSPWQGDDRSCDEREAVRIVERYVHGWLAARTRIRSRCRPAMLSRGRRRCPQPALRQLHGWRLSTHETPSRLLARQSVRAGMVAPVVQRRIARCIRYSTARRAW